MVRKKLHTSHLVFWETYFEEPEREGGTTRHTHFSNEPVKNYELSGLAPKDFQELMMGSYFFVEK